MERNRPYLLSTAASLRRFGIMDYNGYDFSMRCRSRRKLTTDSLRIVLLKFLHNVIIPNAMLHKRAVEYVDRKEIVREIAGAIKYAVTAGRDRVGVEAYRLMVEASKRDGWWLENVERPVNYYVFDTSYSRKKHAFAKEKMARDRRWDLTRYAREIIPRKLQKLFVHGGTPALNAIVEAYSKEPDIALYTIAEFKERFGCSNRTIQKFKKFIRERKASGAEGMPIYPRKKRKAKDATGTETEMERTAGVGT